MQIETKNTIAQKLIKAFIQFNRMGWHQRSLEGQRHSEFKVLMCIRRGMDHHPEHEINVSDISKMLHVTSPTITQLLKGLEANGLVERNPDPNDRRMVGITLTPKGAEVTQKALDSFEASFHDLVEYLGEAESEHLAELLAKVSVYFSQQEAKMHESQWSGDNNI